MNPTNMTPAELAAWEARQRGLAPRPNLPPLQGLPHRVPNTHAGAWWMNLPPEFVRLVQRLSCGDPIAFLARSI